MAAAHKYRAVKFDLLERQPIYRASSIQEDRHRKQSMRAISLQIKGQKPGRSRGFQLH
jgi:hypothetical protein